jgi:predicted 2-oxoglutarate/Fe(II)-dependent dioxygenase YbiX
MPELRSIDEGIFTVAGLLTPAECGQWITTAEGVGFIGAKIETGFSSQVIKEIRDNDRAIIVAPDAAQALWLAAKDFVPARFGDWHAVGTNESLRFYRYDVGQRFEWHQDGLSKRSNQEHSKLTFMVYLNDDFEGGETSFAAANIAPKTGMALFFIHHLKHKGQPVTRGRKYVLRTDVMYRLQTDSGH